MLLLVVMAWSEEETIALIELWGDECIQEQLETVQETELCTINFLDRCKRQDSPEAQCNAAKRFKNFVQNTRKLKTTTA